MPEGIIVKALSGYYYVMPVEDNGVPSVEGSAVQCRARGIFRKRGTSPLVGDRVSYMLTENGEGTVDEIRKRETELIRPPVANVSLAVLVFSVKEPDMNLNLLDKFLVHIEQAGLDALIVLTKLDLADPAKDTVAEVKALYEQVGYEVISTSSRTGEGSELLRDRLAGKISVFSGQSGVGKSSMLNALMPGLTLETNAISMRLGRGKHTTRHVELIPLDNGGFVADTPGFSQLDFLEIGVEELSTCFREFAQFADQCKFRGCTHTHEPGCRVLAAKEEGLISESRYQHYVLFLTEMKDKKRRY
ncbi:ribosome small subunit-dependent GTPase A [Paenibacillus sp. FSL H7-0942]|jgi:ribosome biogenesis GTPase|uniref:ribosome small subunit-dependent GTPase A n=1 Tax=Paenibacillus TaxID=44249 RepID=UPI0002FA2B0F|nr:MULTISPECIES: ribosome small subunit-dependent GTPase A [Paenibacillus]ETT29451.1 ribosome small subunit-dependent GTPase A [Paenibacillus sp. FSL R5-192]ETT44893.1 ribosome small subunit-dependent GTPase A [Paenibacillus sp. FSL H7-689]KAA8756427.1 ribosome small subunit-dependent GTPase A [Paenibacillus sp. UASWS1643]MBD8839700.1 ribosome small subunit-dependent GTPase A [Paenibacillus sp. CFBP 13594]MCL6661379.1 ribosome small subunit-dependent GTPase A [Paenibacillus amylolyticus]